MKRKSEMTIYKRIKQQISNYFHPSVESLTREFSIVEEHITQEDYEKCIELLNNKSKK